MALKYYYNILITIDVCNYRWAFTDCNIPTRNKMEQHQYKVEVVYDGRSILGEGPVYDEANNELIWVDIDANTINFLDLSTKKNRSLVTESYVGAAVPCLNGNKLVASVGRKVVLIDRQTGAATEIASVESDKTDNRINDSKCDRKGRYWFGTMALEEPFPPTASFYSFDGVETKRFVTDVKISNGIAFSMDWTKMYYIDSPTKQISCFDYNESTGEITNRRVVVDFKQDVTHALPDGMTIDSEGKLWVAEFLGSCVCRWDPDTGEMLQRVAIPALKITSCCFGGPDYSTLFVTSASIGMSEEELGKFPDSGKVFAVTELGVKGLPPQFFDDSKF